MQNNEMQQVVLKVINQNTHTPAFDLVITTEEPDEIMKHGQKELSDATALMISFTKMISKMDLVEQMKFFRVLAANPTETLEKVKEAFHKCYYIVFEKL